MFPSDVSTSYHSHTQVTVEQATHEQMEMLGPLRHAEVETDAVKDLVDDDDDDDDVVDVVSRLIYGVSNGAGNFDDLFDSGVDDYDNVAGTFVPIGFGRSLDLADDEIVEKVFVYKISLNVLEKHVRGKMYILSNTNEADVYDIAKSKWLRFNFQNVKYCTHWIWRTF